RPHRPGRGRTCRRDRRAVASRRRAAPTGLHLLRLPVVWALATARFRSRGEIEPLLLDALTAAETAADPPPLHALVGEAVDLSVALWAGGTQSTLLFRGAVPA